MRRTGIPGALGAQVVGEVSLPQKREGNFYYEVHIEGDVYLVHRGVSQAGKDLSSEDREKFWKRCAKVAVPSGIEVSRREETHIRPIIPIPRGSRNNGVKTLRSMREIKKNWRLKKRVQRFSYIQFTPDEYQEFQGQLEEIGWIVRKCQTGISECHTCIRVWPEGLKAMREKDLVFVFHPFAPKVLTPKRLMTQGKRVDLL